jgi:elongation factor Ts
VADITAADVKRLRELTDAPMMACKKALVDADGDIEKAADLVRERTGAKMDARAAERTAAEGAVFGHVTDDAGALVQLSCETDFVAKGDRFQQLGTALAEHVATADPADVDALLEGELDGTSVSQLLTDTQAVTGEKLEVATFVRYEGAVETYLHAPTPGAPAKVGVIVQFDGAVDDALARGVAMHIAAMKPLVVREDDVDAALLDKEKEFARKEAVEQGKPENIIERIVEGKVKKVYSEWVLNNQTYVLDDSTTVGKATSNAGAEIEAFTRLQV